MSDEKCGAARNHHFVPQFYLKGFAIRRSRDAQLRVFDLIERRAFATRPRNIGSRRDYNRVEVDGVDPAFLEAQYAIWEGEADQAFHRIINARSIADQNDFAFVIQLMARLFLTVPSFRERRDQFMRSTAMQMMNAIVSSEATYEAVTRRAREAGRNVGHVPFEQMRSAVVGGELVPSTSRQELIRQEVSLWPVTAEMLAARQWSLIIAGGASGEFATSDRPVILQWTDSTGILPQAGLGLRTAGTTVTFPISKVLGLRGTFEEDSRTAQANSGYVAAVNTLTTLAAMRQVYTSGDFPFRDLDKEFRPFSSSLAWTQHVAAASR